MGHRSFIIHMVVPSALSSLFVATLIAAGLTLAAFLAVKLVVSPLLNAWLTPRIDPTAVLFHLTPGEVSLSSIPARRKWGWGWQPGALVVTDRRIWFLPAAWSAEPWSASRSEVVVCDAGLPLVATVGPIHNWPEHLRLRMRDGCQSTFAVSDPGSLLAYFEPAGRSGMAVFPARNPGYGAFDG
jgi:hypothetical protein